MAGRWRGPRDQLGRREDATGVTPPDPVAGRVLEGGPRWVGTYRIRSQRCGLSSHARPNRSRKTAARNAVGTRSPTSKIGMVLVVPNHDADNPFPWRHL